MTEDPKSKLTNWLTDVPAHDGKSDDAGTRLMTQEQKDFYLAYIALGEVLDIPFFKKIVELDQRLMMAYEGRRSDDVVEALRSVSDPKDKDAGLRPAEDAIRERKKYKSGE